MKASRQGEQIVAQDVSPGKIRRKVRIRVLLRTIGKNNDSKL
jgi:hypothetical protein